MRWTEGDWERLGRALRTARQYSSRSQEEVAQAAGVSLGSVQAAEAGKPPKTRMPYTVPAIARALDWPAGAVEGILNGDDHAEKPRNDDALTPEVAALVQRIQRLSPVQRSALALLLDAFQEGK
ncbi:helix-turn-helix transcriptional regulator [Streptomyces sp. NPDC046237]|uniref:helix-turn-helix domain-containing protein n=1 Tax=Streptomyces sp. NPDC046237 TaxID=3154914 RepID=UPI0033E85112